MILLQALLLAQPFPMPQPKAQLPKEAPAPSLPPSGGNEKTTIVIQAKARADDLLQAFEAFKKEKPTYRISARLASGGTLSDIQELTAMGNGTLFIVKTSGTMGFKAQIVSVDDILDFFFP